MPEQDINTPAGEVQTAPEQTVEKTIGETLTPEPTPERKENQVPESAFLKEKMARKELEKKVKELEESVRSGATHREVSADIASIAKEYDIDPNFLDKLASTIRSETESKVKEELDSKFKPLEEEKRKESIEKVFNTHFNLALEKVPEFKGIVNQEVIKSLSLLPQNANKTFLQLIEETYGGAVTGRRTIPQTVPAGGKESAPLDYQRAVKDPEYFKEVMADPKLKAEYNNKMLLSGF